MASSDSEQSNTNLNTDLNLNSKPNDVTKDSILENNNPFIRKNAKYIENAPSIISIITYNKETNSDLMKKICKKFYGDIRNIEFKNNTDLQDNLKINSLPPITLRTSKTRRATFLQVFKNSSINWMDTSKISDLNIFYFSNTDNFIETLKFFLEYQTMVKSFGNNKIILYCDKKYEKLFRKLEFRTICNFSKLIHFVSCLRNRVTYLKCSNSYIIIDYIRESDIKNNLEGDIKDNLEGNIKSDIKNNLEGDIKNNNLEGDNLEGNKWWTVRGYLRGKPLNSINSINSLNSTNPINSINTPNLHIPGIGPITASYKKIPDPICIKNEKILERKKVFFHCPMLKEEDEFLCDSLESMSSEESDSEMNDESEIKEEIKEKVKEFDLFDFDSLKEAALLRLKQNNDDKLENKSDIQLEDKLDDLIDDNDIIPGDYLELKILSPHSNFLLLFETKNNLNFNSSSFLPDKNFHPNFIKSNDPQILNVGLFRNINFLMFFKKKNEMNVYQKASSQFFSFWGCETVNMPVCVIRQIKENNNYEKGSYKNNLENKDKDKDCNKNIEENKETDTGFNRNIGNNKDEKKGCDKNNIENNEGIEDSISNNENKNKILNENKNKILNEENIDNFLKKGIKKDLIEKILFKIRKNYCIVGTGKIQSEKNIIIKKKLNLLGKIIKVNGNTAFVKDLFTSNIEGNKYILSTVETKFSKIRGIIKKPGIISRISFEGTVKMNDIVCLKCFIKIEPLKKIFEINNEYLRSYREIKKKYEKIKLKEDSSEESLCFGDEIEIENKKNEKLKNKNLISKLPIHKRLEKQKIIENEFVMKNNLKNLIENERNLKNIENIEIENKKLKIREIENEEKLRIKKEGIFKKMKGKKRKIH